MRDSIATKWSDETSNFNRCQSRIWGGLHPLGKVINTDKDKLMTTGRFRWNLPDNVDAPHRKWPWWSQCMQLWGWHVNEISVYLTLGTSLNELAAIRLHSQPEIASSHDLTGQHMSLHVWSTDSRMNLSHLDQQRRGLDIIATSYQLIICIVSHHKLRIKRSTVSMLSYPWPWLPQDIC